MRTAISRFRRSSKFGRRFAVTSTLLAFAVVVSLVTILVLTALDRIADHSNRLDDTRSRETATGAIQTFLEQLHGTLNDYAVWDDAASFVYEGYEGWISSNYGQVTEGTDLFDTAILMDSSQNVLMAYQEGKPVNWSVRDYFDTSLWTLFDIAASAGPEARPEAAGFVGTGRGVAAVAVGLIRKKSGSVDVPADQRRFLIFARHLDGKNISRLSATYVVDGLRFAEATETPSNLVEIRNIHGKVLQRLTWHSRLPGQDGYRQVRSLVYIALAMVGVFFLLLLASGSKMLNRLSADEAAARRLAMTDRLSGLLNRTGFLSVLSDMVEEARSQSMDLTLFYLDLDGFKDVNDAYGHGTGDRLIRAVAAGLNALVEADATLARVGGDEFAIAFLTPRGQSSKAVETLSDRILGFFDEPFVVAERVTAVGTSIGIAVSPDGSIGMEELVRRADMAMYHAKETGRGRAEYYRQMMDAQREERNMLEIDLREAIEREELVIVYQPVVDAATFQLVGVEALCRWNRVGHGPVTPDVFIPIAEASGLIGQLGLLVLRTSCETMSRWPDLKLSVNVSPGQFRDPVFPSHVAAIFRKTRTEPSRVTLEMTEGYFIQRPERAQEALYKLKRLGVKIALDDFGSGFSSVGYLRQFGFDRMKIDKSLVQALDGGDRALGMMKATVSLAQSLDIPVTAEGVETERQAVQLRRAGCDELQGYFFGKPMSADEIDAIYCKDRDLDQVRAI